MIKAKIVAHSLSPQGDELISVLATFPRIILAEVNTHRMLSKNTSSSRAIPFNKMVEAIQNDPFIPIAWQKDHKGMQGTEYFKPDETFTSENPMDRFANGITDKDSPTKIIVDRLKAEWLWGRDMAVQTAKNLHNMGVHYHPDGNISKLTGEGVGLTKQLCNRLLEPFMWTTMLITGSREGWDNFFKLRNPVYETEIGVFKSKRDALISYAEGGVMANLPTTDLEWLQINKGQAEIHMMMLSEKIYDAVNESTPKQLIAGEWHIPFEDKIDTIKIDLKHDDGGWDFQSAKVKISTAMAAHTSYTTVGNEPVKSYEKWIELHDKLIAYNPPHSSPMEHCAKAMSDEEYKQFWKSNGKVNYKDKQDLIRIEGGWCYNLKGFISLRYFIDNSIKY